MERTLKSILKDFNVEIKKKKRVVELALLPSVSHLGNGRVRGRVALLACAIADPDLTLY